VKRACVIGYPILHSRSPLIHGYWLREHRIEGEYLRREVRPDEIDGFLQNFASQGLAGCNVTLPHKEAAARNAKHVSAVVRTLGVANTLWLDNGELHADNTDASYMQTTPTSPDFSRISTILLPAGNNAPATPWCSVLVAPRARSSTA